MIWTADIGVISDDGRSVVPKIEIMIEYNLAAKTATLLNTGKTLPLSSEKVYVAYVDSEFEVSKFVELDPNSRLENALILTLKSKRALGRQ
ncbi:MAG: hypothetical protein R3F19_16090 [Verrucomicrobiales bacterium]